MTSTAHNESEFDLREGHIHIWSAELDLPASTERQWPMLSEGERQKAEKFLFARDRDRYAYGRSILRVLLSRCLNVTPPAVTFRYGSKSKPELAPPFDGELHFNVSHSRGQLLIAVAKGVAVGVDLEMIRPEMDVDAIATRFFAMDEIEQLEVLNNPAKRNGFFNGWTRKEAYLKARGEGIGYGLDQFAVSLVPGKPARLLHDRRDPDAIHRWAIRTLAAAPGYVAAVSAEAKSFSVREFPWDPRHLVRAMNRA
jgi:4'-phosphopantetheinyl transferase